jgi:hypothetical protein
LGGADWCGGCGTRIWGRAFVAAVLVFSRNSWTQTLKCGAGLFPAPSVIVSDSEVNFETFFLNGNLMDYFLCVSQLDLILARINDFKQSYTASSSSYEVFLSQTSVKSVQGWQYENSYHASHDIPKEYESRDSGMADVLSNFREFFRGPKTILYAHNH